MNGPPHRLGLYDYAQRVVLTLMAAVVVVGGLAWVGLKIRGAQSRAAGGGGTDASVDARSSGESGDASAPSLPNPSAPLAVSRSSSIDGVAPDRPVAAGENSDAGRDASELAAGREKCEALSRDLEALAAREAAQLDGGATWRTPDLFRRLHCAPEPNGGAWAAMPTRVRPGPGTDFSVEWEIVHLAANGLRAARAEKSFVSSVSRSFDLEEPELYDFDGNGEPEMVLLGTLASEGAPSTPFGRVYTLKHGAVTSYAGAPDPVMRVEDIDDDGRPDIVTNGAYTAVVASACDGVLRRLTGPLLAAHALADGGFVMSDEAAGAYVRRTCPSSPATLVVHADARAVVDGGGASTAENLVCARLWGKSEAEIVQALTRECRRGPQTGASGDAGDPCAPSSRDDDVCARFATTFRAWLSAAPPLRLDK